MFPSETRPYIDESVSYEGYPQNAEKVNGRWAMVGFVALLGAYVTTGFYCIHNRITDCIFNKTISRRKFNLFKPKSNDKNKLKH